LCTKRTSSTIVASILYSDFESFSTCSCIHMYRWLQVVAGRTPELF
jgi:hypothetical protein